jgi:hypothetical protein
MLYSVMLSLCASFNGGPTECDVRIKYLHEDKSQLECRVSAQGAMQAFVNDLGKNKKAKQVSAMADCFVPVDMNAILNVLPEFMEKRHQTYSLTFY